MNKTLLTIATTILGAFFSSAQIITTNTDSGVSLAVDTTRVVGQIDGKIYGQFLEHIYHSCNGGLWGERVWNRSFEEKQPVETTPAEAGRTPFRHWQFYGQGTVAADAVNPLNCDVSARLNCVTGEAGLEQSSLCVRAGETYRGSIWVRGQAAGGLVVRLLDGKIRLAELSLPAPADEWREIPIAFKPSGAADNATLQIGVRGAGLVWLDQVSLMPDSWRANGGFRPDLLQAIAELHPTVLRWPGGSYANTYRWKSGIGPQAQRRTGPKAVWDDLDVNSLGTDEYVALCRKVGAQPLIDININRNGTNDASRADYLQDACDWVDYCNGPATSKWGEVRARNGHPEPYHVVYWEIDNEVWNLRPEDYVRCVKQFAPAMKRIDPHISLIACGSGQLGRRWGEGDLAVIGQCAGDVDYLSVHVYANPDQLGPGLAAAGKFIAARRELIAASKNPRLQLFFSEWNAQSTDWRTGLYAGGILNTFERSGVVGMATPALFLRHVSAKKWDNALINFDQKSWFPAPNYVVMKLWRDHYAPQLLEIKGDSGSLNVVATRTSAGDQCFLKVINLATNAVPVRVRFAGSFKPVTAGFELVAPGSLAARNTLENPQAVKPVTDNVQVADGTVAFSMPQLSAGVVSVK